VPGSYRVYDRVFAGHSLSFERAPALIRLVFAALIIIGIGEILAQRTRRRRIAWALGLGFMHVFWVNLHGSHLLGVALVSLAMLSCLRDREALTALGLLLISMLAASCVSPYGPRIVLDAIAHTLDPRYRGLIDEWRPFRASLSLWYLVPLLWQAVWVLASFWLRPPSSSPYRRFEALYTLLLLLMAAGSTRFFADVASAQRASDRKRRGSGLGSLESTLAGLGFVGVLAMALSIAGCLALPPGARFGAESARAAYPSRAQNGWPKSSHARASSRPWPTPGI